MSSRYLDLARQAMRDEPMTENAPPRLPGRAGRPCLACGRQCPEGVLFETDTCFETWKARRTRATSPHAARSAMGPARSIPPETSPEGGAV
jgi:hypothetical protein